MNDVRVIRCSDDYGGRWCRICGACQCRYREGLKHDWAPVGTNAACKLHSTGAHGAQVRLRSETQPADMWE